MKENIEKNLLPSFEPDAYEVRPRFFRLSHKKEKAAFYALLKEHPSLEVHNRIKQQLKELIKSRHPSTTFTAEQLRESLEEYLNGEPEEEYGVWVYYPWSNRVVHLLEKEEFVELRTSRNLYKITKEERRSLATKKIGVVGLSVGQSVALMLAMERSFGELRIADFDTLDLTNLNRLRAGVHQLGVPKTTILAREIAEIDPYLKVSCFEKGIQEESIDDFIHNDGKLDLLIEECDSLDIKILCREKARKAQIPVLMDTSDRGMIDIERFDIEQKRPLLHGLIEETEKDLAAAMKDPEQRLKLSLKIGGGSAISNRLKESIAEIGQSISTWPQLASAVALGGAIVAETSRRILCGETVPSGRFYVDTKEMIKK